MRQATALLFLFLLLLATPPGRAQGTNPAPDVTASRAAELSALLRDERRREEFIRALDTLATLAPASPGTAAGTKPSTAGGDDAQAGDKTGEDEAPPIALEPNSVAADVVDWLDRWADSAAARAVATARGMADLPGLGQGLAGELGDAGLRAGFLDGLWRLLAVVAAALAAAALVGRLQRRLWDGMAPARPAAALPASAGDTPSADAPTPAAPPHPPQATRLLRRLPFALGRLALALLPLAAFALAGGLAAAQLLAEGSRSQLLFVAFAKAWLLYRVVLVVVAMLVAPGERHVRLVRLGDGDAAGILRWTRRLAGVAAFGGALAEAALVLGLSPAGQAALLKLVGLSVHLLLVLLILRCRGRVAGWVRGTGTGRPAVVRARRRLAAAWHVVAIAYVLAAWLVWAMGVEHGFARLQRFVLVTAGILVLARLAWILAMGALERLLQRGGQAAGADAAALRPGYFPLLRRFVTAAIAAGAALLLLEAWGIGALAWLGGTGLGGRLMSAAMTIGLTLLLAVSAWELANAAMDRRLARLTAGQDLARAARLRTLQPILRTTLFIVVAAVVVLTTLSEVGVNIAPLLAGAGIVGVAVGFGSQTLVRDVITGLFLLLENAMQVGDWVTVAGLSGTVEKLSIRTIRIRAGDGSVHIVPFSAVTSVTNNNRGLGNAAVSVSVAASEDTDRVADALKEVAAGLRADPEFGKLILSDLALWGVDKVDGAMVTVLGQIPCVDTGRWPVQREFNRRMKKRFQELGIRIALPVQAVVIEGAGPPLAAQQAAPRPA